MSDSVSLADRLREACEGATAGPWQVADEAPYDILTAWTESPARGHLIICRYSGGGTNDAEFIAQARSLVPEAADLLDAQATRIAELEAALRGAIDVADHRFGAWTDSSIPARTVADCRRVLSEGNTDE